VQILLSVTISCKPMFLSCVKYFEDSLSKMVMAMVFLMTAIAERDEVILLPVQLLGTLGLF